MICKEIGVSRTNLYRKMKTVTELSPIELIRNKRLDAAAHLLLHSDLSIFDIAVRTGFNSQAYFSKCFKSVYGCAPSEYTEQEKKTVES
jgi:AraC-like DNA-binding protein